MAASSALIWPKQAAGASVYFHNLAIDGNEANCPIGEGAITTFAGDGATRVFNYNTGSDPDPDLWTPTITSVSGVETIIQDGIVKTGTAPNFVATLRAPAVGETVKIYNIFKHEQSSNVKWKPGTGTPDMIGFNRVSMTGMVADGYHANVQTKYMQITDWESYGRTRRSRADIQLSRIPTVAANVVNYIGDSFEMEPSLTNVTHQIDHIPNMLVRGAFDMAGDKPPGVAYANVKGS